MYRYLRGLQRSSQLDLFDVIRKKGLILPVDISWCAFMHIMHFKFPVLSELYSTHTTPDICVTELYILCSFILRIYVTYSCMLYYVMKTRFLNAENTARMAKHENTPATPQILLLVSIHCGQFLFISFPGCLLFLISSNFILSTDLRLYIFFPLCSIAFASRIRHYTTSLIIHPLNLWWWNENICRSHRKEYFAWVLTLKKLKWDYHFHYLLPFLSLLLFFL